MVNRSRRPSTDRSRCERVTTPRVGALAAWFDGAQPWLLANGFLRARTGRGARLIFDAGFISGPVMRGGGLYAILAPGKRLTNRIHGQPFPKSLRTLAAIFGAERP